jgi:hypothetical protein
MYRLNIPVGLCIYILRHRIDKQMRLFFYMKTCTSGHFKLTEEFKNTACEVLKYKSIKTFNKHFNWLILHRWITVNSKKGSYRIIGLPQIAYRMKTPSAKCAEFNPIDWNKFKGFISGAVITYLMINKSRRERRPVRDKGSTRMSRRSALFFMPHFYLAMQLGITKSKAQRVRQSAINAGYVVATKNFNYANITTEQLKNFRKYSGKCNIRIINNIVMLQQPDILKSKILLKRKLNLKFTYSLFGKK